MFLASWFRSQRSPTSGNRHAAPRKAPARRPRRLRLELERLEDRTAPATLVVTSAFDPTFLLPGTLRYAVHQANQDAGRGQSDTIIFDPDQMGTSTVKLLHGALFLDGTGTPWPLAGSATINGGGVVTISGNHLSRVFFVDSGMTATLTGLTIRDGFSSTRFDDDDEIDGGGILNQGTLTVSNSTLSGNSADVGGGISNQGDLTVSNSTLSGNRALVAGGIDNNRGELTVTNCTIAENYAIVGGGIDNSGTLTATNCTIARNSATDRGGGINNSTELTVTNCTIAGNTALGGGGIDNTNGGSNFGYLTVTNCTIAGNSGGGVVTGDAAHVFYYGSATITNTIIARNTLFDVHGTFRSLGNNLIGNGDGSSGFDPPGFPFSGDRVGTGSFPINPLLGPLQDNGGPTQTMALLPGSRAIDAGRNAGVPAGLMVDQRGPGFYRFSGARVDIGAFERQEPAFVGIPAISLEAWENVALAIPGFSVGDVDSSTLTMTVAVGHGTLTLATPAGLTVSNNGTATVSLSGSLADLNAALASLLYQGNLNFVGSDMLSVTASDGSLSTQVGVPITVQGPTATVNGLSQPNPLFILAGDALNFSGTFSDPGALDGHAVTWDFGDGNSTTSFFGPGGSASFSANHAFAAPGTYVVTLTVTDEAGGVGTAQMTVIVQTPAGAAGSLLSDVQSLAQLNAGQQNSLVSTLNAVTASLTGGNTTAAKNQLGAFENKVKALFQAGRLTRAQEDTLLSSADAIEQGIS